MNKDKRDKPTLVTSAFVEKDNKFLLVYDPKFKIWRVPGGRVEFGEKVEDCLAREMKEELNLDIQNPLFLGFGQDQQYHHVRGHNTSRLLLYYYVKTNEKLIIDKEEASDYKWIKLEELKNHENLEEGMIDLFKRFPDLKL